MVQVTFNSSLAQKEPNKPDPVGTEQTLLPADTDVEQDVKIRRQWSSLCCWHLWVAVIVVAIATIVGLSFFFVFAQEPKRSKYSNEDYIEPLGSDWCHLIYPDDLEGMEEDMEAELKAEMSTEAPLRQLEERVQVLEDDNVELIQVPEFKFSGTDPAQIVHDFSRNLTAFLDLTLNKCYVIALNTSAVLPPRDLQDMLDNIKAGTYQPQSYLAHEQLVVTGRLDDLEKLGPFISKMCRDYETYGLERRAAAAGIQKREALNCRRIRHFENVYVMETQICEL